MLRNDKQKLQKEAKRMVMEKKCLLYQGDISEVIVLKEGCEV